MGVLPGASIPSSLHDIDAFLLVDDADKQREQLKLPARVYCFALSQFLAHHLQEEGVFLKITNPGNSPDYNKDVGQSAKFYWGTASKKLCVAKWVLTVNFDSGKQFKEQPCILENWTCRKPFKERDSVQVFCCKRSLEIRRLFYMFSHPLGDLDKLFPVLEPAEKAITRFDDVLQGREPWISEWAKK